MTPYGPSDLSWSYWSYDYSSSFHAHLRPLYRHHPNDHHGLGCISLKRRPAVEGWHDDMLPTAPVLEPLLKGHSFQRSTSLNVNPLHGPFLWKNNSIYIRWLVQHVLRCFFDFCFFVLKLVFFYVRGAGHPNHSEANRHPHETLESWEIHDIRSLQDESNLSPKVINPYPNMDLNVWYIYNTYYPASSKWPFDHPNGGHLAPERAN